MRCNTPTADRRRRSPPQTAANPAGADGQPGDRGPEAQADSLARYFSGEVLYGDDFDSGQIEAWYEDEREGYADLGARDRSRYHYAAHELNRQHVFRHLPARRFPVCLGVGSAWGDELLPIADRLDEVTILDPSDAFHAERIGTAPVRYVKPDPSGVLPFDSDCFDLATCFGVLHHIPNVSLVVSELARVLRPGGVLALREPMVSMGDWRQPRRGLTRRERGIPRHLLERMAAEAGLAVLHRSRCTFPVTVALYARLGRELFNSRWGTRLDRWASSAFAWNERYHATTAWQKLRPSVAVLVLAKPAS